MRRDNGLLIAATLFVPGTAFAQAGDVDDAQSALLAGNADQAVAILTRISRDRPNDADILRRLANAQAAATDYSAALATISRAEALAPSDNDIVLAKARILLWSGDSEGARATAAIVEARAPDYPDLPAVQRAIMRASRGPALRSGVAIYGGVSGISLNSGADATWYNGGVSAFGQVNEKTTLTATVDYEKRRQSDTRLGGQIDWRIGRGNLHIGATATPNADFREKWSVSAGGELPLGRDFDLVADVRHAEYATNSVTTALPGLRWRATRRIAITGRWINLFQSDGAYRSGVTTRIDYQLSGDGMLFAGAATYPDTEAGITRQVRSAFAGIALPISDRLTLRASGEYDNRRDSYERKALTIGVGWRFGG